MKICFFTFLFIGALALRSAADNVTPAVGGTFTFVASNSRLVQYSSNGVTFTRVPVGNPAQIPGYGKINLAFYAAPNGTVLQHLLDPAGTPDLTGWLMQTLPVIQQIVPIPGFIPGRNVTLDASLGPPETTLQVELVGWTGNFPDFQSAVASGVSALAWTGSGLSGGAFGWSQVTGDANSQNLPTLVVQGPGGFNGLVFAVPEPSAMALGISGAATLLLFRRRK